jgi:circadian clock protein KaiB
MSSSSHRKTAQDLEKGLEQKDRQRYVLKLYVAGITPRSAQAIQNVTELCERHLKDRYVLRIVDIYQNPTLAKGEQIIAAPTLIKQLPLPLRRLIGNMANEEKMLVGLDLRARE